MTDALVRFADAAEVDARVERLAARVADHAASAGPDGLVLVGILTGGVVLVADLVRHLDRSVAVDFVALTALDGPRSERRRAALAKDLDTDVVGRHVVLVDDLVDSGIRTAGVVQDLSAHGAASVDVVALLDRPAGRLVSVPLLGAAFEVGDERLVGSGLDLDGWFRSLPGLWRIVDEPALRREPARVLERALSSTSTRRRTPGAADPSGTGT